MVARSQDFGSSWYLSAAASGRDDADKPVLTVHGAMSMWGFNHEQNFLVAASHDYAQTFASAAVNPGAEPAGRWRRGYGRCHGERLLFVDSLRAAGIEQPPGWRVREPVGRFRANLEHRAAGCFGAPLDCSAEGCEAGYLGAQVALASDAAGTLYALWNAVLRMRPRAHVFF